MDPCQGYGVVFNNMRNQPSPWHERANKASPSIVFLRTVTTYRIEKFYVDFKIINNIHIHIIIRNAIEYSYKTIFTHLVQFLGNDNLIPIRHSPNNKKGNVNNSASNKQSSNDSKIRISTSQDELVSLNQPNTTTKVSRPDFLLLCQRFLSSQRIPVGIKTPFHIINSKVAVFNVIIIRVIIVYFDKKTFTHLVRFLGDNNPISIRYPPSPTIRKETLIIQLVKHHLQTTQRIENPRHKIPCFI